MISSSEQTIANYAVEGRLASGLLRARRLDDGAARVLRLLPAPPEPQADLLARLDVQADTLAALGRSASPPGHPAIASVDDWGIAEGFCYLAYEALPDAALYDLLRGSARRPLAQALALLASAAEGLAHAHAHGLLHRNLTPASLRLAGPAAAPSLLIADFALAGLVDEASLLSDTAGAETLSYALSPERIDGLAYDGRSEVFSLGIMLYEICTGFHPFAATSLAYAYEQLVARQAYAREPRELRPDLPEALSATIMRCLRAAPADRFADAAELARVLRGLLSATPLADGRLLAPRLGGQPRRPQPAAPPARTPSATPQLRVLDWRGEELLGAALGADELLVGRAPDCGLRLDDPTVAEHHLLVEWRAGENFARAGVADPLAETFIGALRLQPGQDQIWNWQTMLQLGPYWIWLDPPVARRSERATRAPQENGSSPAPLALNGTREAGPEINRVVDLSVEPNAKIAPGTEIQIEVALVNKGSQNVRIRVEAGGQGFPADAVKPGYTTQALTPKQAGKAWLKVMVPRQSRSRAGSYRVVVRAFDDDHGQEVASQDVSWEILPFSESVLKAAPDGRSFWRRGRLTMQITNRGNAPERYLLRVEEPEPSYVYGFLTSQNRPLVVDSPQGIQEEEIDRDYAYETDLIEPGKKGEVKLAITLPWEQWRLVSEMPRPITTELRAEYRQLAEIRPRDEIKPARATFQQRALIPLPWWSIAPLLLLLAFLVYGYNRLPLPPFMGFSPGFMLPKPTAIPLPPPTASATPTVTATPSGTPTSTATSTSTSTATPVPTNTPLNTPTGTPRPANTATSVPTSTPTAPPTPTFTLIDTVGCINGGSFTLSVSGPARTPFLVYIIDPPDGNGQVDPVGRAVGGGVTNNQGRALVQIVWQLNRPGVYSITARARNTNAPMGLITSLGPFEAQAPALRCIIPTPIPSPAPSSPTPSA